MGTDHKRTTNAAERSRTQLSPEFLECLRKWIHVFNRVYRQPMEEGAIWAYREVLCDLSPEELDRGCIGAMKATKFTPTPAEIREHGVLPSVEPAPLNALPTPPPMTDEEAKEFFAHLHTNVLDKVSADLRSAGVIVITDKMRADYERKKAEALERFGKSA